MRRFGNWPPGLASSCHLVYRSCMDNGGDGPGAGPTVYHRWEDEMKKDYHKPEIKAWGTVADLTATGLTHPGSDAKSGSAASMGG